VQRLELHVRRQRLLSGEYGPTTGIDPKVVSERVGHAFVTIMLDTYSHASLRERRAVVGVRVTVGRQRASTTTVRNPDFGSPRVTSLYSNGRHG
jgi:hypothetical protein